MVVPRKLGSVHITKQVLIQIVEMRVSFDRTGAISFFNSQIFDRDTRTIPQTRQGKRVHVRYNQFATQLTTRTVPGSQRALGSQSSFQRIQYLRN